MEELLKNLEDANQELNDLDPATVEYAQAMDEFKMIDHEINSFYR